MVLVVILYLGFLTTFSLIGREHFVRLTSDLNPNMSTSVKADPR